MTALQLRSDWERYKAEHERRWWKIRCALDPSRAAPKKSGLQRMNGRMPTGSTNGGCYRVLGKLAHPSDPFYHWGRVTWKKNMGYGCR